MQATTAESTSTHRVTPAAMDEAGAAVYIGFSREFLRQSRSHGARQGRTAGPPFVKVGRSVRYRVADLDAWLVAHRREIR